MKLILFVCTGNFYRSRFAEYLFNHFSRKHKINAKAFSKGLEAFRYRNQGNCSSATLNFLNEQGVDIMGLTRYPLQMNKNDFNRYNRIIFMDQEEHSSMLKSYFPEFCNQVEFWNFADNYIESSETVLPRLFLKVSEIIHEYS